MVPSVLVVDDDAGVRTLLRALCTRHGLSVDCCDGGEAGLRKIAERDYDAILLDLMMPEVDGFEMLRRMRPELREKVIVITAMMQPLDGLAVRKVVRKPFEIEELMEEVSQVCRVCQ